MTDALTIGWNTARVAERRATYRRVLALNLCIHLAIGLACLFFPNRIADVLGLPGPIPTGWTRGWGATLLLVTALYVPGWLETVDARAPNVIVVLGRVWTGTVWVLCGGGFLWFAALDYVFAVLPGLLYWRLLRDVLMSRP